MRLLEFDQRAKVDGDDVPICQPDQQHEVRKPLVSSDLTIILRESEAQIFIDPRRIECEKILIADTDRDERWIPQSEREPVRVASSANVARHLRRRCVLYVVWCVLCAGGVVLCCVVLC